MKLKDTKEYHEQILLRAAKDSQQNDRMTEAIKLYNLAGDFVTVMQCLSAALGNAIPKPNTDERTRELERTAREIMRHYERINCGQGRDRDAVIKLLRVRSAMEAKEAGRVDYALEVCPSLVASNVMAHVVVR